MLVGSKSPQAPMPSKIEVTNKVGELMDDGSMQLTISTSSVSAVGKYAPKPNSMFLKIGLMFKNVGQTTIRIDPSYVFMLNGESYLHAIHESTFDKSSSLKISNLELGDSIAGDVVVELPKEATGLIVMYSGPNNLFLARIQ
jgi:hypothetical protein